MSLMFPLALLIGACYLAWMLMNRILAIRSQLRDLNDAMRQSDRHMTRLIMKSREAEQSQDE